MFTGPFGPANGMQVLGSIDGSGPARNFELGLRERNYRYPWMRRKLGMCLPTLLYEAEVVKFVHPPFFVCGVIRAPHLALHR
jgi:hypothetical protein